MLSTFGLFLDLNS